MTNDEDDDEQGDEECQREGGKIEYADDAKDGN